MCLVGIAWQSHARYPLVIAGNRDELHARPSAPADWWPDGRICGGRDLVGGGSWLALSRSGRFAVVTNQPDRPPPPGQPPSRGALVHDWVAGASDLPEGYLRRVTQAADRYAGFTLVVGSLRSGPEGLIVPTGLAPPRWRLPFGITALANAPRERPPPKALWLERELQRLLAGNTLGPDDILGLLGTRTPVAPVVADSGPARARLTPFLVGEAYGTRASTVAMIDADGHCDFVERRFDATGNVTGESRLRFTLENGPG